MLILGRGAQKPKIKADQRLLRYNRVALDGNAMLRGLLGMIRNGWCSPWQTPVAAPMLCRWQFREVVDYLERMRYRRRFFQHDGSGTIFLV
jgi:hypothetical protein